MHVKLLIVEAHKNNVSDVPEGVVPFENCGAFRCVLLEMCWCCDVERDPLK